MITEEIIRIDALDKDGNFVTGVSFFKRYYDNKRYDVLSRGIEQLINEVQKSPSVSSISIFEDIKTLDETV